MSEPRSSRLFTTRLELMNDVGKLPPRAISSCKPTNRPYHSYLMCAKAELAADSYPASCNSVTFVLGGQK